MKVRRRALRVIGLPVSAITDPMALVTALSATRLTLGLRVPYWDHDQVDRQLTAADELLRALDPTEVANLVANA
jgi:hypothetical protein